MATAVKPIWHRDWDVLWQAASECNMPISFHTTGPNVREPNDAPNGEGVRYGVSYDKN